MVYNPFSLEGKTILVTGASSGIGRGIAVECSKMGARVVINGRNDDRLNETLFQMEGKMNTIINADIATQEGIDKLVSDVPELDGFVNSAGIPSLIPLKQLGRDYLTNILNVNTVAPITLTANLIKRKKIKNNSSIVIISSINGSCIGNAGSSPYSASKGALIGFVRTAALELAGRGTRINTISPGLVRTNILEQTEQMFTREELEEKMLPDYPMKRLGKVEDIANGVIYLLSDASGWVTGQNLIIDGGYTIA
jgi:NAD(P)-dependent dehydrogenase (short-subunit alcohol dehydrogenase family)